ncbi:Signal peptidase complex subunit 2 [Nosema granulosis]|uniref:Signal peptidase complex subunit 2 n=1 Tax=Nosema granulosis TaxID=83296 RepID=A0A9P6H3B1_9MICR|nr:Signal peptidase complex subunit 2 [Nosema granulosis]
MEKLIEKYSKKPIKAEVYSLSNLKITLDDLLLEYLTKVKNYKQKTFLVDLKILMGVISTIVACAIAYLSVNYEFQEYKNMLILGLSVYFGVNTIVWVVEKTQKATFKFEDISVFTDIQAPSPIYTIMVYEGDKLIPEKYTKSVFDLYTEEGRMLHEKVLNDFKKLFK